MADQLASVEEIRQLVTECDACGGAVEYGEDRAGAGWFRCDNPACKDVSLKFQVASQKAIDPALTILSDIRSTLVDAQDYRALLADAHKRIQEVTDELTVARDALEELRAQHERVIVMLIGELDRERWNVPESMTQTRRRNMARSRSLEQFVRHALICTPAEKCVCGFEEGSQEAHGTPPPSDPVR